MIKQGGGRVRGVIRLFLALLLMVVASHVAAQEFTGTDLIQPYKQNYLLIYSHNFSSNYPAVYGTTRGSSFQSTEAKFQISLQGKLWQDEKFDIGMAYTQQAYWQLYNKPLSSPFRESNFEPEIFFNWKEPVALSGVDSYYRIAFSHQSNGRSRPMSRSWNRIYGEVQLTEPYLEPADSAYLISLKGWFRIPEKAANDDNPDITKYYGYWELNSRYAIGRHKFHLMLRNNLRTKGNRGAIQLDWSWKVLGDFNSYVQFFSGYGESLVEYNHRSTRIGAGILLSNW